MIWFQLEKVRLTRYNLLIPKHRSLDLKQSTDTRGTSPLRARPLVPNGPRERRVAVFDLIIRSERSPTA